MKYPHWSYYLTVIDDLVAMARYIEFSKDNFGTYSIELVRTYLAVGSEIDVVAKLLCKQIAPGTNAKNIHDYRKVITKKYSDISTIVITAPKYDLSFTPWENWKGPKNPIWWDNYNGVKHHRDSRYKHANLEQVLLAVSGLCVLLGYFYADYFETTAVMSRPLFFFDEKYKSKKPGITVISYSKYKLSPD